MLKTRDFTYDFVNYRVEPKKLSTFTVPVALSSEQKHSGLLFVF